MTVGWRDLMIAQAAELRKQGKSMILLWMDGGPSQFETFNPKPGSANQGPAKTIQTSMPGIEFAEFWPQTAKVLDKIAQLSNPTLLGNEDAPVEGAEEKRTRRRRRKRK